jgi:hypothetical protein
MRFILTIFFCATVYGADLLPASRRVPWIVGDTVGYPGGIPTRTHSTNIVTDFGADTNGIVDASPAFVAANAALAAVGGGNLIMPEGDYRFNTPVGVSQAITVKGAGTNRTRIKLYGGLAAFELGLATTYVYSTSPTVTNGFTKGSTSLSASGDLSNFLVGRNMVIARSSSTNQFETPFAIHNQGTTEGYDYVVRQVVHIVSKSGQTIGFYPPLYDNWTNYHTVKIVAHQYSTLEDRGIEDLTVNANGRYSGIRVFDMDKFWLKRVHVYDHSNYGIALEQGCLRYEITGCRIDEGPGGTASNGAGLLVNTSSAGLIEDNIIENNFPSMEINFGSSGNVIAYNFMHNTNGGYNIDINHGPHTSFNLIEGNVCNQSIISDGYFGSEGPNVYVRNRVSGMLTAGQTPSTTNQIGYTFAIKRWAHHGTFLANISGRTNHVMGYSGFSWGDPNMGNPFFSGYGPPWADWPTRPGPSGYQENDTNVLFTAIKKGNWNYFINAIPADEALGGDTIENSYYLTGNNTNWMGTNTIPMITTTSFPIIETEVIIPAQARYYGLTYTGGGGGGGGGSQIATNSVISRGKSQSKGKLRLKQ